MLFRVIPPLCAVCGAPGHEKLDICIACIAELIRNSHACQRCALPMEAAQSDITLCGHCLRQPPHYDFSYAFALYEPPLDRLIQQLKFNNKLSYAQLLGSLMVTDIARNNGEPPELIIPVPLHPQRLRQRGFNQALEIARPIAKQLAIPMDTNSCQRTKATTEQSSLSAQQRADNIKGAFTISADISAEHVVIVDDVMTTGNTVSELARTIKKTGVHRVDVWVCARALT
ncbi:MAG: ComF family protein [Gammaproteobacteria bacterium]|nr:ComF family protein [Gammaproteobacteria bacterium]